MFLKLLLLFVTIPVLELAVFLVLGSRIGVAATLAVVVLTAVLGAWLTKSQGIKALRAYHAALAAGRLPHREVIDGLMILVAGAVLLTPGFLTDAAGFALLVPAVRTVVRALLTSSLEQRINKAAEEADLDPRRGQSRIINVEAEVIEDTPSESRHRPD